MFSFPKLTEKQDAALNMWVRLHNKGRCANSYHGACGGNITLEVTPTAIETFIGAKCNSCGARIDLLNPPEPTLKEKAIDLAPRLTVVLDRISNTEFLSTEELDILGKTEALIYNLSKMEENNSGHFIKEYKSAHEAARENNIQFTNICKVCRGERKTAGGFGWSYTKNTEISPIKTKRLGDNTVLQFTKDGEFVAEYSSAKEARRQTGINDTTIGLVCKGKGKTAGGFVWKYKYDV